MEVKKLINIENYIFRINVCNEAGIYNKWKVLNEISARFRGLKNSKKDNFTLYTESSSLLKISLFMFNDIFIVTGIGLLFSIFSFMIEISLKYRTYIHLYIYTLCTFIYSR